MGLQLSKQDLSLLRRTYELSTLSPRSDTAFAVGSLLLGQDGSVLTTGYSRELGEAWHAEAVALHKAAAMQLPLDGVTLFTSLEPCSRRKSGRTSCCELILQAGIRRVVFGTREPPVFVTGEGAETLREAGVAVLEDAAFDDLFRAVNAHLFGDS